MKHQSAAPDTESVSTLLLGGGYALSALSRLLEPHSFVITTRDGAKVQSWTKAGIHSERVQLDDTASIQAIFRKYPNIQTVIDSIPPLPLPNPTLGVKNLLDLLPNSVKQIFYLSTTGVYGKQDGSVVDEDTERTPFYPSAQARVAVEDLYFGFCQARTTTFRLSGIYGPGRGVGLSMKNGTYRLIENDMRYTNRIHVDDIAAILQKALQVAKPLPSAFNLSDDCPTLAEEVFSFYSQKFGIPPAQYISQAQAQSIGGRLILNQRVGNTLVKDYFQYEFLYPSFKAGAGTEFA